jgi:erythromycin esterase
MSRPDYFEEKVGWLQNNTASVSNIENEDFEDLQAIKQSIGNAEIVMLGEQSHGAGASFIAKTKIIKMLHEEMGFDILAFENGLYESHQTWKSIQSGEDPYTAFENGVIEIWSKSKQLTPLIKYIDEQANSKQPLIFSGFDFQFSGAVNWKNKIFELEQVLNYDSLFSESTHSDLYELFSDRDALLTFKSDSIKKQNVYHQLDEITLHISTIKNLTKDELVIQRMLIYTKNLLTFMWELDFQHMDDNPEIANMRDKSMADNLIWLKEVMYPGKKIIVWGANSHLMYNRHLIIDNPDKMIPIGHHLKNRYGDKLYSIAFTSHNGLFGSRQGNIHTVNQSSTKSLEYLLNEVGSDHLFIDKHVASKSPWLSNDFRMKAMGSLNWRGKWFEMCDGIFFTREMTPNILSD